MEVSGKGGAIASLFFYANTGRTSASPFLETPKRKTSGVWGLAPSCIGLTVGTIARAFLVGSVKGGGQASMKLSS